MVFINSLPILIQKTIFLSKLSSKISISPTTISTKNIQIELPPFTDQTITLSSKDLLQFLNINSSTLNLKYDLNLESCSSEEENYISNKKEKSFYGIFKSSETIKENKSDIFLILKYKLSINKCMVDIRKCIRVYPFIHPFQCTLVPILVLNIFPFPYNFNNSNLKFIYKKSLEIICEGIVTVNLLINSEEISFTKNEIEFTILSSDLGFLSLIDENTALKMCVFDNYCLFYFFEEDVTTVVRACYIN
ncbi:hypothetical protein CWI38_1173p0010 [Hamiltosporidium tvaerminnensis]|uniref:Uncharacterized protein n=2 Tax=Hamiltosporidium TaxID=1176354 RepID=A0A4Q9LSI8_9MICR|nr:hypothetical protein CWI37_1630p0010 [Hamiltosporidium tvaerminnensis]TBT98873.1 hypothetical protein CWI39_2236p0020 [Hamiltosporidium magnivora]TBU11499.1 hypothetical protein CWI38_1173p0010 [Hamiltosporidium tvaerminnensis]